jgi:hypothetical protein
VSGASASARSVGSAGSGDPAALAFVIRNTWSRAGHARLGSISRMASKFRFEKRASVRSSRPRSQNSPRTSASRGTLGDSRKKTKTGLVVFASRIN